VRPISPCFEALYAARSPTPSKPATEDDRTLAGGQHFFPEGLRQQEWSEEIDFEDAAIVFRGSRFGGRDEADAGIDEHIHAAPAQFDSTGEFADQCLSKTTFGQNLQKRQLAVFGNGARMNFDPSPPNSFPAALAASASKHFACAFLADCCLASELLIGCAGFFNCWCYTPPQKPSHPLAGPAKSLPPRFGSNRRS
jgi:hypothetical protein